jgi:DNA-binding transcriptional ArsR family regulator
MVVQSETGACDKEGAPDLVFAALSHPARRDMVRRTLKSDHAISGLARRYDMSFAAVQKHVAVLEEAGLVTKTRRGREQLVRADPRTLAAARESLQALEDLWVDRLERFEQAL